MFEPATGLEEMRVRMRRMRKIRKRLLILNFEFCRRPQGGETASSSEEGFPPGETAVLQEGFAVSAQPNGFPT